MKHKKLVFIILFIILVPFMHNFDANASDSILKQEVEEVNDMLTSKYGFQQLKKQFSLNAQQIKVDNPDLYYYELGVIKTVEGDFDAGYSSFRSSLKSSKELSHNLMSMHTLRRVLELDYYYNSFADLLSNTKELEQLAIKQQNLYFQITAFDRMATAYYLMSNDSKVLDCLTEAVTLGEKANLKWVSGVYNGIIADIKLSYGKQKEALPLLQKATEYLVYEPNDVIVAQRKYSYTAYNNYQLFKAKKISFKQAATNIKVLIKEMDQNIKHIPEMIAVYSAYGKLCKEAKIYSEAIDNYEYALKLTKSINHYKDRVDNSYITYIQFNIADSYYGNKEYKKAADLYAMLSSPTNAGEQSLEYVEDVEAVQSTVEKEFTSRIDLLSRFNEISSDKIKLQSLLLKITGGLLAFVILSIIIVILDYRRLNVLRKKLYIESTTDGLTQTYNRSRILQILDNETSKDSVVALLDVDHFKQINDTYGHLVGDQVLRKVATTIKGVLREGDKIGRYGGEEFLIVLEGSSMEQGIKVCERVRLAVEEIEWDNQSLSTSVSIGLVQANLRNSDVLLREADELLYKAKNSGRNRLAF